MSLDRDNDLPQFAFWTAYCSAGKLLPKESRELLSTLSNKAQKISLKSAKDISYQDFAESFRLCYELLRKIDDENAKAAVLELGAKLYKLLNSLLEDDKRKQFLLSYAFWREKLNSVVIEGATYFKPVLDALPHEESILSTLSNEKLQFLTLVVKNCIQNAQNYKNEFPLEIDTGDNIVIDLLNYIGTLILVVAFISLIIEVTVSGGLVISLGALSLTIEHLIAGMLITSASCYTASAGVHYVYELPLENEAPIYENDKNSLRLRV
jgi:hypothetical protein